MFVLMLVAAASLLSGCCYDRDGFHWRSTQQEGR